MKGRRIPIFVASMLAGCSQFSDAESAVRQRMKDPDATQFREVRFCGQEGQSVVTGEYNGKNSYGAYEGFANFYYSGGIVEMADDPDGRLFTQCLAQMSAETEAIKARTRAMTAN